METLETLIDGVRSACAAFPDGRRGEVTYFMADIGLSAFSLFFMQSESFLSYQRGLEEGRKTSNCRSLFGMTAIPTDNHIRAMLDPVPVKQPGKGTPDRRRKGTPPGRAEVRATARRSWSGLRSRAVALRVRRGS